MRAATHLATAGLTGVMATGFGADLTVASGAALAVGSLLPDIDTQHSGLGRLIKPLSSKIERTFGHRTITHSLLGMVSLGILSLPLLLIYSPVWVWLQVGVFTHILLDTANVTGVPFLYPLRTQFWMLGNRSWRVPYSSPREFAWLAVISLTALALVPLSMDGFSPWFHRALGTAYGAVEDYNLWHDDYEVWAEIRGENLLTSEKVSGRYRIIDALSTEAFLIEDEMGRAYSVGLGAANNITSQKVRAWRGERIVTSTYRLDLQNRLMSDLINSLPKGAKRVYVNAAFNINTDVDTPPVVGYFERIKKFGEEFEARAATIGDLAPLANYVIEGGSAVIRAEYSPENASQAEIQTAATIPNYESHILAVPNLPDISGLVVNVGDYVAEGEYIARYVDDKKLEINETELEAAQAKIPRLEEKLVLEEEAHKARLNIINQDVARAKEELATTTYLVNEGAIPRVELAKAQADLEKAEGLKVAELTNWTSKKYNIDGELEQARLTIARAEQAQAEEMDKQWITTPVAGTIVDINIVGVGIDGVDLEIVLLEQEKEEEIPYLDLSVQIND